MWTGRLVCLCEREKEKLHIVAFDLGWQLAMHVVAVLAWSNMSCVYANTQTHSFAFRYLCISPHTKGHAIMLVWFDIHANICKYITAL